MFACGRETKKNKKKFKYARVKYSGSSRLKNFVTRDLGQG